MDALEGGGRPSSYKSNELKYSPCPCGDCLRAIEPSFGHPGSCLYRTSTFTEKA
jgi:hypothetical protein